MPLSGKAVWLTKNSSRGLCNLCWKKVGLPLSVAAPRKAIRSSYKARVMVVCLKILRIMALQNVLVHLQM